jgi:hypothetical protein
MDYSYDSCMNEVGFLYFLTISHNSLYSVLFSSLAARLSV